MAIHNRDWERHLLNNFLSLNKFKLNITKGLLLHQKTHTSNNKDLAALIKLKLKIIQLEILNLLSNKDQLNLDTKLNEG